MAVTSPPYHNAISYASHQASPSANYRERETLSYEDDYRPLLAAVWRQCWGLLRPGGHLAINLGTLLDNGAHIPVPQHVLCDLLRAEEPWEPVRTIYWNKCTAGVRRAGSVIRHALPGYWYPNIMTEHVMVLRKPGDGAAPSDPGVPPEWWLPVWDLAPVPPRSVPHPAPFPEDLPHRLIRMFTAPADIVFDPFLGAGATAKAAHDLGRGAAGCDVSAQYVAYARSRLSAPTAVRELQLRSCVVPGNAFVPRATKGKTRHGAGIKARSARA